MPDIFQYYIHKAKMYVIEVKNTYLKGLSNVVLKGSFNRERLQIAKKLIATNLLLELPHLSGHGVNRVYRYIEYFFWSE